MTQSESPPGEKSKKISLKLLLRQKPATYVDTSAGRIYLYPLRVRDMADFGKLEPGDAVTQIRAFLPSIGSLTVESDEVPGRISLDAAIANDLSGDEIEQLADAYAQSSALKETREGAQEQQPVTRNTGEAASAYLLRLLKAVFDRSNESAKQMAEKLLGSSRGLFDQVRKSYAELDSTVKAYEAISRSTLEPSLSNAHLEINNHLAEHSARMARDRAEELEMARLTGKMTAESAKTLKDLAEAATTLMEQMDARNQNADKSTRKQITIAVWSVAISAALALIALVVSGFGYIQNRDNNASGDRWQTKLLTTIEQGNEQRSAAGRENQALREQMKALGSRIADMEAVQHSAAKPTVSKRK